MNRLVALVLIALSLFATAARAQTPEDQYVRIYNLIQQADGLSGSGRSQEALTRYLEAQTALQRLHKLNPEWNIKIVNYRLNYLAEKITGISGKSSAPAQQLPVTSASTSRPATPRTASEAEQQMSFLQEQVRQLQADRTILEAKLKEALATQPASIDPRELTRAQEKIQSLLKENELLKTGIDPGKVSAPTPTEVRELEDAKRAVADANRKLAEQTSRANALETNQEELLKRLSTMTRSDKELADAKLAVEDANRKLAEQTGRANTLAAEQETLQKRIASLTNETELASVKLALQQANRRLIEQGEAVEKLGTEKTVLETRVRSMSAASEAAEALRAENELLKKQLAEVESATSTPRIIGDDAPAPPRIDMKARRLAQAEAKVALLQSEAEILRSEKSALEKQLRAGGIAPETGTIDTSNSRSRDARRIKQLVAERDELKKQLSSSGSKARIDTLTQEIAGLRARVETFEAKAVPYTAEELALFKPSGTELSASISVVTVTTSATGETKKTARVLPIGTTALAQSAQKYFAAREFDKAEAAYLEILKQDEKNVYTLGNLAAIQLEMNRLDESEKNVKAALEVTPDDGYSLAILGYLKFRQEKYDDALDALSRAAKVNPQSAEVQNYLGVTLSHKGMRGPAETALRKAIQIDPNYAKAHNNLAVIYASQTPPLVQLARWHYQKAMAAGHERNPELEKLLEQKAASSAGK